MRVVLLGAPGSGKGTQGAVLAERWGVPYLSTGDLLREQAAHHTELGRKVRPYLDEGELVPDDLVVEVLDHALRRVEAEHPGGGYLVDGFPRTIEQADKAAERVAPDVVVHLTLPDEVARERLLDRGSHSGRRDDADPAVIDRRLRLYHDQTEPLLAYYRDRSRLVTVDATGAPDAVTEDIVRAVDSSPGRRDGLAGA